MRDKTEKTWNLIIGSRIEFIIQQLVEVTFCLEKCINKKKEGVNSEFQKVILQSISYQQQSFYIPSIYINWQKIFPIHLLGSKCSWSLDRGKNSPLSRFLLTQNQVQVQNSDLCKCWCLSSLLLGRWNKWQEGWSSFRQS